MDTHVETIHIFVQIDRHNTKKLEFPTSPVTGLAIKAAAGVAADSDLASKHADKLDLVTNDQSVEIKNGDHFVVFPPGTIS